MDRLTDRTRRASKDEGGFTLAELLVVMLILGILAAIALPVFFNQKSKADDVKAKQLAHSAQIAMEACGTKNSTGIYTGCNLAAIQAIEPTIPAENLAVNTPNGGGYTVTVTSTPSNNTFSITRSATGAISYPCTVASSNRGGCPGTGVAEGSWG